MPTDSARIIAGRRSTPPLRLCLSFPDESSVVRLVGAVLMERADEWEVERRPFSVESMRKSTAREPEMLLQLEASPMRLAPIH